MTVVDLGINLWGSDWMENGHYLFPTEAEIDYFAAKGFTNIRLPFTWETIQPTLNGKLDASYVAQIQQTIDYAKAQGIDVILDVHNYGAYNGNLIGSKDVPVSAFADLWGKIAAAFADDTNVRFGLMNEPQLPTAGEWLTAANSAIAAIRAAGANQEVLVPGAYWTGGQSWTTTDNAEVLGAPGAIVDPAHNFAFEVHQYLDDTSGQNSWVVSETIGVERLTAITEWARAAGAKLYLGEFGVADNAKALAALDNMMKYITDNDDVWQSASYWVAGSANPTYMYTVEPQFGLFDAPQMDVLENYTGATTAETHLGDGTIRRDYYVDGRDMPSMSDIVTDEGVLVSRTLFDADGDMRSQATVAADGGVTITTYPEPGASYPFERDVYDADHNLLVQTVADDTGASTVKFYHAGEYASYRQETYRTDGTLDYTIESTSNGITGTNYSNGIVTTVAHYDSSWTLLDRETYDAKGRLTQIQTDNTDGTHTIASYNVQTGRLSSAVDYSSSWHATSVTSYDANENPVTRSTTLANGYLEIDHYVPGKNALDYSETLTADNKLVSRITYHADGYVQDVFAAPGSSSLSQTMVCALDGHVVALTKYDADGLVATVQRYNSDGTYSQENYDAAHQQHPASTDVFGPAGDLERHISYGADGLVTSIQYENADGTHTIETYSDPSQSHPVYADTFDTVWNILSRTRYDADGDVTAIDTIEADGGHTTRNFAAGTGKLANIEIYAADGQLESRTNFDINGLITSIAHENADGTHTIETYSETSQSHPVYTDNFDPDWNILSRTQFDANGDVTAIDTTEADGSHTIRNFVAGTDRLANIATYTAGWQLEGQTNFDINGLITSISHENADGTHTVENYTANVQDHATSTDQFDADWSLIRRSYFNDDTLTVRIDAEVEVTGGVDVNGSGDTVLTNRGTVAGDDFAIQDSQGTLTLVNRGTITGDVDLGSGDDVFDVRAGDFSGTVEGGSGDDTFKVSASDTEISEEAGGGDDIVFSSANFELGDAVEDLTLIGKKRIRGQGNELDNQLTGNSHNNRLFGLGGNDTLWGGAGRDVLFGGEGSDTFELRAHSGKEVVRDFEDGIDRILVSFNDELDLGDLLEHHMRQRGEGVVIHYGNDRMVIEHTQLSEITAADFIL